MIKIEKDSSMVCYAYKGERSSQLSSHRRIFVSEKFKYIHEWTLLHDLSGGESHHFIELTT